MTELAVCWSIRLLPPLLTTVTRIKTGPIPLVYAASRRTDVRCRAIENNAGPCTKTLLRKEGEVHILFKYQPIRNQYDIRCNESGSGRGSR